MKKLRLQKLIILFIMLLLIGFVYSSLRIKTASSFLTSKDIQGVSLLYNAIENRTTGACPQIENGQPEMDEFNRFLQSLNIQWYGTNNGRMDVPLYYLYFCDEEGMPQVTMFVTSTGYLYCGHWVYRIVEPDTEESWMQLGVFYERAVSQQNE